MTPTKRAEVRRLPARASYEPAAVHEVLDASPVGHLGISIDGQPFVIPMLYGRDEDVLYLHGSVASRLGRSLATGIEVCLTATVVDGLVLARSAFHHSVNYRSVVVFGTASEVVDDEKVHGLRCISEHLAPGRWAEVRPPNDDELRRTKVLRLEIVDASVKVRRGDPIDDEADLDLPIWAGVVPCALAWGEPVPAADLRTDAASPPCTA